MPVKYPILYMPLSHTKSEPSERGPEAVAPAKIETVRPTVEKHPMSSVAFSGIPESHRDALRSYFERNGQRVIPWSPHISSLVCSPDAADSWKTQEAVRRGIPLVLYTTLPYQEAKPLWVDAMKPKTLADVIGHGEQIKDLLAWLHAFPGVPNRVVLITGPPGIGKTTVAHLVAAATGYTVVERNASDERSGSVIKSLLETASKSGHVGEKRLLIMDEVDGCDRGGVAELARLGKTAVFPILCIANERTKPKLKPLVSVALDVRFARPAKHIIARALKVRFPAQSQGELEILVERSGNDIRSVVNALQFNNSNSTMDGGGKDVLLRMDPFSAAGRLFHPGASLNDRTALVFVDAGLVPLMVAEGYVGAAGKPYSSASDAQKLERCAAAAEFLSFADLTDKRVYRSQSWDLMAHSATMTVAAATVVEGPAPFQLWPQWLGKQSKRTKHRSWIRDMEQRSRLDFWDSRDLLRARLFKAGQPAATVVDDLEALRLTRDDMMETLAEVAFSDGEVSALDTKTKAAITREWTKRCGKAEKAENTEKAENLENTENHTEDEDAEF